VKSSNPFRCFDARFLLSASAGLLAIYVLARLAHRFGLGSAPRIGIAVAEGLVMAALIAYSVLTIRKLDELGQRIQLVAIAVSFAATGGAATLYAFLVKAGMPPLEWAIWLWPFMSLVWGVSVLVINRRYQ
jgi:hypothetical protein